MKDDNTTQSRSSSKRITEIFSCRVILLGPGSESVLLFEVPIIQPAFMVITLIVAILRQ